MSSPLALLMHAVAVSLYLQRIAYGAYWSPVDSGWHIGFVLGSFAFPKMCYKSTIRACGRRRTRDLGRLH